jgi:predicted nucleic acid-binding protein
MLIYCDSVILIYWLDQVGPFHLRAQTRLGALQAAGDRVAVSDLTRLECRVGPLKRKDPLALTAFDNFFARLDVQLVHLTPAVFDRAAQMRADLNFKTPDALHLSAAIEAGCHLFLTNDARLSRCTDIPIDVLP